MPPPAVAATNNVENEDCFNRIPQPIINEKIHNKLDKIDKLESILRKRKGVNNYMLDLEGLFEPFKSKLLENFKMLDID